MITIPLAFLRDYYYNTFYYSHMVLLFVYIPLAMIHAPVGPVYFHAGARLWIIMLAPLVLYAWFRMPKFFFPKKTWVLSATLEEDVLVLAIDKVHAHHRPVHQHQHPRAGVHRVPRILALQRPKLQRG